MLARCLVRAQAQQIAPSAYFAKICIFCDFFVIIPAISFLLLMSETRFFDNVSDFAPKCDLVGAFGIFDVSQKLSQLRHFLW